MLAGVVCSLMVPLALAAAPQAAAPAPQPTRDAVTWQIDGTHSEVSFRVRHLVSRVRGTFGRLSGTIVADPARLAGGTVAVEIETASINTNNERRDTHLRSADFFDAEGHPRISFRSTEVVTRGEEITVRGTLTMRGVTRPVVLEGRVLGITGSPGRRRMGFEATTTVNRMDYGVSWNRAAEGGGAVLGDEVEVTIALSAVEQPAS